MYLALYARFFSILHDDRSKAVNKEQEENKLIGDLKDKLLNAVEGEHSDIVAIYALLEAAKHIARYCEGNEMICDEAISEVFNCDIVNRNDCQFVYEVRNVTDEELYYPKGIFLNLESAVSAVKAISLHDDYLDYAEYQIVKIKTQCIHGIENGISVYSVVFKEHYNEETDEYEWQIESEKYHADN